MSYSEPQDILDSTILIVDDAPDNLRLLSSLLTERGWKVRKVTDGQWAIQSALLSPPDLILLDIIMPGMNGYEVCSLLKITERTRHIPIIFLSVNDEALDKVMAFRLGGVDYITKPFEPAEVLVRVETQLRISQLQSHVQEQNVQLQEQNLQLRQEIDERIAAQVALEALNQELEVRVQARTAKVKEHNEELLCLQAQLQDALTDLVKCIELKDDLHPNSCHFQKLANSVTYLKQLLENASTLT